MSAIQRFIDRWLNPIKPLVPGIYPYKTPPGSLRPYRLYLRLEVDGAGLLLINAATVLHLNPTAAEYAYCLVHSTPAEEAAQRVAARYRVSREQAQSDYLGFVETVESLLDVPDLGPVSSLELNRRPPYSGSLSAPYRLDCALTYRNSADDPLPKPELSTHEWQTILDKAWEAGIPHAIFTGGEPTVRPDLVDLLDHAETLCMVTGLVTDGLRLADSAYLDELLQAGLDHAMIVLQPQREEIWDSLAGLSYWTAALEADLHLGAHLTITPDNASQTPALLDRLAATGVHALSLSASHASLAPTLQRAREQVAHLGLTLLWDLPVPYSSLNPVVLEIDPEEAPPGAGRGWLHVEPDGDVLPAQGADYVLGNFLHDPWETIWNSNSL